MACQSLKIVPVDMAGGTDVEQDPPTANVGSLDTRNFNALLGHIRKKKCINGEMYYSPGWKNY